MMKKLFTAFLFLMLLSPVLFSQRILINETFETSGFTGPDSLPTGWLSFDQDNSNPTYPNAVWKVRDTSADFPGVNPVIHSRANFFTPRGLSIPWRAGGDIADDWAITPDLNILTGDSLIFWM